MAALLRRDTPRCRASLRLQVAAKRFKAKAVKAVKRPLRPRLNLVIFSCKLPCASPNVLEPLLAKASGTSEACARPWITRFCSPTVAPVGCGCVSLVEDHFSFVLRGCLTLAVSARSTLISHNVLTKWFSKVNSSTKASPYFFISDSELLVNDFVEELSFQKHFVNIFCEMNSLSPSRGCARQCVALARFHPDEYV